MGFYILPGHIQQLEVCCFEEVLWRNVSWLWVEGWAVEDVVTSLEACDIWTLFVDSLLLAKCCLDVVLVWWLTGGGNMTWICPAENLRRSPLALASITGDEKKSNFSSRCLDHCRFGHRSQWGMAIREARNVVVCLVGTYCNLEERPTCTFVGLPGWIWEV